MIIRNKLAAVSAVAAFTFASASAAILVNQTPHSVDGYYSDGVAGQFYDQRMADNFSLGIESNVTKIVWWGSSENWQFPDLTNFSAWVLRIYNDSAGNVGSEVFNTTVAKASTNPTATGQQNSLGGNVYRQEAAVAVNLLAGNYWLSIGSVNISPGDDAWVWSAAQNTYDDKFAAELGFGNGYQTFTGSGDLSFQIEGDPVPEPATMLALGVGLAALAARRRRK
ncbi:MAG: PEP-CTERM sorting domain-containing protein [Fimbriimonadales bacterium]|nr:PEP-CTERM sorting domain-containing protein [Fimbriimonadales bacterium]